jgi:hypothetical protein
MAALWTKVAARSRTTRLGAGFFRTISLSLQFQMASFYLRLNDLANARRYFERCMVLASDFADGWVQLTVLLMKLGNLQASERALAVGLANCPSPPGLHLDRVWVAKT